MAKKEKRYASLNLASQVKTFANNNEKHLDAQFKVINSAFSRAITHEQTQLSTFTAADFFKSDTRIAEVVKILHGDSRVDKALVAPISKLLALGVRTSEDLIAAKTAFGSIREAANHAYEVGEVFGTARKLKKLSLMTDAQFVEAKATICARFGAKVAGSAILSEILGAIGVTPENQESSLKTLNAYLSQRQAFKLNPANEGVAFAPRLEIAEGKIRYAALAQSVTA